ncbi:hypothetical protein [Kineosporia babensis]|uniref:Uncharacterized protein n=1 Tax=Kineosporia babensis TaxID=499548 RepID=A0A9X1NKD4_9ACTN|nr:hypothetical protein [Kineosporia babensis]MCD5315695.1 hypothetical protein [Kineosporia babensis]
MSLPTGQNAAGPSRREQMRKARQSRRPSRLGQSAGAALKPDYLVPEDAGFPSLLKRTWQAALAAADLSDALESLLTLDGHVPADIQLRALSPAQAGAVEVLFGRSWHPGLDQSRTRPAVATGSGQTSAPGFLGEIALDTSGRVLVRVPSAAPLARTGKLVSGVIRVPWTSAEVSAYRDRMQEQAVRFTAGVQDARGWLNNQGDEAREQIIDQLKEAALRTAPFVLYSGDRQYTNFREHNTLTGKTLWPGHPDCALSSLSQVPVAVWSDEDVLLVVGLHLLIRSNGFARIEEANGTQLSLDHVAHLLERTRLGYNDADPEIAPVPAANGTAVTDLDTLAGDLAARRRHLVTRVQLYREIHGPLMHKIERVADAPGPGVRRREAELCARLTQHLPLTGSTLEELQHQLAEAPQWLARPHGQYPSGLESLVYETVRASSEVFRTDMAMSRGMRSLTRLVQALKDEQWPTIAAWDTPNFFCCVVPTRQALAHFGDSPAHLADASWAISARMHYNSWHFLVGNLPKVPEIAARDYFVPPVIPDIAHYSDQHHHGHVAAKVRFSIRSPQSVRVLGRPLNGFVDLRLLRCEGPAFEEADLLAAHRTSAFVAQATGLGADLVAQGEDIEISTFDSQWHWDQIAGPDPRTR